MVGTVPMVQVASTVKQVIDLLATHANTYASIAYIYIVDQDQLLIGVVSIKEIFTHRPKTLLTDVAQTALVTVYDNAPAYSVALAAIAHSIKAVPVVSQTSRQLLGVVASDCIQEILHDAHTADILARAGSGELENAGEALLSGTPLLHIRRRLPWLLLGLGGGLLAATLVHSFEEALTAHVLLVAFIPLVVYLADAVGSQTEIIFVRALALDPSLRSIGRFRTYLTREFVVSGTLAIILSLLMAGITVYWFQAPELVLLLATALVGTLVMAMLIALCIPYIAVRLGYDPALTSGPVATVVRDVLTLVIYFAVVSMFF